VGDDRDAEERAHHRVGGRPPLEPGVGLDVVGAVRVRVGEHRAEEPVGPRQRPDLLDELVAHPRREELREAGPFLVGDPERRVARADQIAGRVHEHVQHHGERSLAGDREHDVAHRREGGVVRPVPHPIHPTTASP
jgi:hypothetical protein